MGDTKLTGDIAEHEIILYAMRKSWGVSKPVGDRLPYDLILDIDNVLIRIQVKSAWWHHEHKNWVIDTRRCKTNRKRMIQDRYGPNDFDFAIAYIANLDISYIFPIDIFLSYKGCITMVEGEKRQRKPKSAEYRNAWNLIEDWTKKESCTGIESTEVYLGSGMEQSGSSASS